MSTQRGESEYAHPASQADPTKEGGLLTRRQVIGSGMALSAGGLLVACGGTGRTGSGTGSQSIAVGGVPRRGGILKVGVSGGSAKDTVDAHKPAFDPDIARAFQLYETITRHRGADFKLVMQLAESVEPNKRADVWTVRLRDGVQFHNGRPLGADDLIFTIRRILDPKTVARGATSIAYVDAANLRKLDARTVRVPLNSPTVTFPDDMSEYYMGVVPVGYDPASPVGTGPFRYESFTPGQQSIFVRNPHYWEPSEPLLDAVQIIDIADDTARVNALLSGQVQAISNLPAAEVGSVKSAGAKVLNSETGGWTPITMRCDLKPFDDVRVRQAFRLIADRQQLVDLALSGYGRVANDMYSPYDPDYDHNIPQRHQDIEQAKSLLRAAGREGMSIEMVTSPVYVGVAQAAEVFAQQAKAAGVKVSLRQVDTATFYGPNYLKWNFAEDFWGTYSFLVQAGQGSLPNSPYNEPHWNDPTFISLVQQARRTIDDGKRRELVYAAQEIHHASSGDIIWGFFNLLDGHGAKVGGLQTSVLGYGLNGYNFRKVGYLA